MKQIWQIIYIVCIFFLSNRRYIFGIYRKKDLTYYKLNILDILLI